MAGRAKTPDATAPPGDRQSPDSRISASKATLYLSAAPHLRRGMFRREIIEPGRIGPRPPRPVGRLFAVRALFGADRVVPMPAVDINRGSPAMRHRPAPNRPSRPGGGRRLGCFRGARTLGHTGRFRLRDCGYRAHRPSLVDLLDDLRGYRGRRAAASYRDLPRGLVSRHSLDLSRGLFRRLPSRHPAIHTSGTQTMAQDPPAGRNAWTEPVTTARDFGPARPVRLTTTTTKLSAQGACSGQWSSASGSGRNWTPTGR